MGGWSAAASLRGPEMLSNNPGRAHWMTFELVLEGTEETLVSETANVTNALEVWCLLEAIALKAVHASGYIRVIDDNGETVIVAGLHIALETIKFCKNEKCELKSRLDELEFAEFLHKKRFNFILPKR